MGAPKGGSPEGWGAQTQKGGAPKGGAPKGGAPKGGAPKGGRPKISRFFSLPATIFFLSSLSWGSFRGILVGFLKRKGPEMCTFGVLGLSCASPRRPGLVGPPGFHTTAREPKRAHFRALAFKTPPKFNEKTSQREKKEWKLWREREKKERNFGRSGEKGRGRAGGPGTRHTQHTQHTQHTHNTHNIAHDNTNVVFSRILSFVLSRVFVFFCPVCPFFILARCRFFFVPRVCFFVPFVVFYVPNVCFFVPFVFFCPDDLLLILSRFCFFCPVAFFLSRYRKQCLDSGLIMSDVQSIYIPSSIRDWHLEVKIWATDRQCSFCLWIPWTKTTRILIRSTWMHRVMHNTCMKPGRNIRTRYIGSTSILLCEVPSNTIERYNSSRNTSSLLYSESCQDGNWRNHLREIICVTSASSKDLLETWLVERIGFRSCSTLFNSSNVPNWTNQTNPDHDDRTGTPVVGSDPRTAPGKKKTSRSQEIEVLFMKKLLNMIERWHPLSAVTQVTSQVTSQCWTRWTLTSEYLDCHILLWNKLRTLVFVKWSRRSRTTLFDMLFNSIYN